MAFRVFHAHRAALDAQDPVRGIAELEHVAREAFDREVFVQRAHHLRLRLEQHGVVGVVGNRSAGRHRRQRRAALAAQHAVDRVAVQVGGAPAAARVEAVAQHTHDFEVFGPSELRERRRTPVEREQIVFAPLLHADLGDDLLRQHIERFVGQHDAVELAARHGVE